MGLYTTTGDEGETSLSDGTRVGKGNLRVCAYGEVDELNAWLGYCQCKAGTSMKEQLATIQRDLFRIGTELSTPSHSQNAHPNATTDIQPGDCRRLEGWIDQACAQTEPLTRFILPGGTELAARLHVARTCCRRAERAVVAVSDADAVHAVILIYLNRLSDLLFAWARLANHDAGEPDILWNPST